MTDIDGVRAEMCDFTGSTIPESWDKIQCVGMEKDTADSEVEIDAEIMAIVNRMDELATAYPEKFSRELKAAVTLEKTQGLLSADGKSVVIEAPDGWK